MATYCYIKKILFADRKRKIDDFLLYGSSRLVIDVHDPGTRKYFSFCILAKLHRRPAAGIMGLILHCHVHWPPSRRKNPLLTSQSTNEGFAED